jgi:prefoldin alpha subunit
VVLKNFKVIEMAKDEEISKYLVLIEQYKEQISQLEYQTQYIQAAINDYNKAKITLDKMNKIKKGNEILVPIGGSSYLIAKTDDTSKVLFDIGAGIITEKKSEEAITKIEKNIGNLEKTQKRVIEQLQKLQNEASEISQRAQTLMSNEK